MREFEARDVEQVGDLLDGGARRPLHVDAFERRAHLDLEEHAQQVRPMRAGLGELLHASASRSNSALLPRVKCCDGRVDLRAVEPQLRHDLARGGDLRLGDAPVGLGDVAHDLERGA